jgi:8-amino-7-oxononanoate synthase
MTNDGPVMPSEHDAALSAVSSALGGATRVGLFDKCRAMTERVAFARAEDAYCYFRVIESSQDPEVVVEGRTLVMLGSNNYLGLTNHPRVKEAAVDAVRRFGTGCAGSRLLNGTLSLHEALEDKLARFIRKEAAVTFSTGFQVNLGTISSLLDRGDIVYLDKQDHACIIDGARLSFARVRKFEHNDPTELRRLMATDAEMRGGRLIVVDGVFSMEGDIAPLPQIVEIAREFDAAVMVDDAHGLGVLGRSGRGTAEHFDLEDDVHLVMGTFSKSLASIGGFIAGERAVIDHIRHSARSLIFSAALAPASVAAASAAVDIVVNEPERREQLWRNTRFLMDGLSSLGFHTGDSQTPVIPIIVGDDYRAFRMTRRLQEEGVFVNPVVSPATPRGRALLRTSCMATHTEAHLTRALEACARVGREFGIIP